MKQRTMGWSSARVGIRLVVVTFAVAVLGVGATAGTSAAHNPAVQPSCSGLRVEVANYGGPVTNNAVTVTIDGVATTYNFATDDTRTFPWNPNLGHTWTVVVDANRVAGNPTQFDASFSGTEAPCVETTPPTTASTVPSSSTTPSSTAPTSTTELPTTTTIVSSGGPVPPTTSTPSTSVTSTTMVVGVDAPVPGARPATSPRSRPVAQTLPATGATWVPALAAVALLSLGAVLVLLTRRPATES
jgi:LPXTG-motif cell wall-anchored protein